MLFPDCDSPTPSSSWVSTPGKRLADAATWYPLCVCTDWWISQHGLQTAKLEHVNQKHQNSWSKMQMSLNSVTCQKRNSTTCMINDLTATQKVCAKLCCTDDANSQQHVCFANSMFYPTCLFFKYRNYIYFSCCISRGHRQSLTGINQKKEKCT